MKERRERQRLETKAVVVEPNRRGGLADAWTATRTRSTRDRTAYTTQKI
jgi:hypothetical protein